MIEVIMQVFSIGLGLGIGLGIWALILSLMDQ